MTFFDEYISITNDALKAIEDIDIFLFEKNIAKRQDLIDENKSADIILNQNQKNKIIELDKKLNTGSLELFDKVKKEMLKIKQEKNLQKYEKKEITKDISNKIDSSH